MQVWLAPGTQLPMPSQRPASITVEPVQVCPLQELPGAYSRHVPLPLQAPSVPQLGPPSSVHWFSGSEPAGMAVHVPRVAVSAHDVQVPVQRLAQQTPCWQKPDAQSPLTAQSTPARRLPQVVPLQTLAPLQLALTVQDVRHVPPVPHTYGSHDCWVPGTQAPAPSQRPASVAVEPEQLGATHPVPAA
jgi:hypothetical protein